MLSVFLDRLTITTNNEIKKEKEYVRNNKTNKKKCVEHFRFVFIPVDSHNEDIELLKHSMGKNTFQTDTTANKATKLVNISHWKHSFRKKHTDGSQQRLNLYTRTNTRSKTYS